MAARLCSAACSRSAWRQGEGFRVQGGRATLLLSRKRNSVSMVNWDPSVQWICKEVGFRVYKRPGFEVLGRRANLLWAACPAAWQRSTQSATGRGLHRGRQSKSSNCDPAVKVHRTWQPAGVSDTRVVPLVVNLFAPGNCGTRAQQQAARWAIKGARDAVVTRPCCHVTAVCLTLKCWKVKLCKTQHRSRCRSIPISTRPYPSSYPPRSLKVSLACMPASPLTPDPIGPHPALPTAPLLPPSGLTSRHGSVASSKQLGPFQVILVTS